MPAASIFIVVSVMYFIFYCNNIFKISNLYNLYVRPLGRSRRRGEDNIRIDLEEIGISAGNWVDSAQDRNYWRALVNAALNLRVP